MLENARQSSGKSPNLLPLVELIYDAAADATLWPAVLDQVGDAINSEQITIWLGTPGATTPHIAASTRSVSQDTMSHAEAVQPADQFDDQCRVALPAATARHGYPVGDNAETAIGATCRNCELRHGTCCPYGLKVRLNDKPAAYLICMRPRTRGSFEDLDGSVLKQLVPHLQRSFRLYLENEQAKSLARNLKYALDGLDRAIFGLNREGAIVLSNRRAERIVEAADGLEAVQGRLAASSIRDNSELQSRIARCLAAGNDPGSFPNTILLVSRASGKPPLQLLIVPTNAASSTGETGLATLILIADPARESQSCAPILGQMYGLTPTECRLADLLLQGFEVRDAAGKLRTTLETARFHVKRILAKTGTRRQTELMRLMLSLPGS